MVVEAVGRFACVDTNHPTLPLSAQSCRRKDVAEKSRL
jgi:hypothetical protein